MASLVQRMKRKVLGRKSPTETNRGSGRGSELPLNSPEIVESFYGARKSDQLLIVASGPSATMVPSGFSKTDIAVLNSGFLHPHLSSWRVNYYLLSGLGIHHELSVEEAAEYYQNVEKHINNETFVCLNDCDRNVLKEGGFLNGHVSKSNLGFFEYSRPWKRKRLNLEDPTKPVQQASGVLMMMLQLAIVAGYKEIFLIGAEHDYIKRYFEGENDSNFYHHDVNSKREFLRSPTWSRQWDELGLGKVFKRLANIWETYSHIEEAARSRGVEIVNVTPGTLLDVFERRGYDFS